MKKTIVVLILGALILQGVTVVSLQKENEDYENLTENIILSKPKVFLSDNSYIDVKYDPATSYILEPGDPLIPKVTKVFDFPIGTHIKSINVEYKNQNNILLEGLVQPAPEPVVDGSIETKDVVLNTDVYQKNAWYPSENYNTIKKVGLNGKDNVIFLSVQCYPVKYNPKQNLISYAEEIEISIDYYQKSEPIIFPDEYDLLIITPQKFSGLLNPLVTHKNNIGVNAYLQTTENIYSTYTDGRDDAEKIKLAIKDARETKGITYVMLVGGHIGQTDRWYIPERDGISNSETYSCDLYYADIYKLEDEQLVFEDWDSNGDGQFAQWKYSIRDQIDGSPDVYVGRLACRDKKQVETMVEKIINYESTLADNSWFKNMLLIGGDTYADSPDGIPEAEIDTNLSGSYMDDFNLIKLWASDESLTGPGIVEQKINEGAGFIHMAGHANPAILVTHPLQDDVNKITIMQMYNLFDLSHINPKLTNADKLPIIVIGGCHNSQFNVGLDNVIRDIKEYGLKKYLNVRFFYMEWVPKCFSWWLTSLPDGGAIATFGNTGLGMGIHDYGYLTGLDGWLFPRFFYHYGEEGMHNIGMAQGLAINDYVLEFDINKVGEDRQMVQQWALLGDPSLLPGGYD